MTIDVYLRQIRHLILFVILGLTLSGITAFPLESEMKFLMNHSGWLPDFTEVWIHSVYNGIKSTNDSFPFIMYGTDWLAFAHLIIAILFIGVYRNPVKNSLVIDWAICCCVFTFPLAFIAGPIRQIPFFHQLIDCAFGAIGLIPLFMIRQKIKRIERITAEKSNY